MHNGEIPSFPVCYQVCVRNNIGEESECYKTMAAENSNKNNLPMTSWQNTSQGENNKLADCLLRCGCVQDKIKLPGLKVYLMTTQLSVISDKL